MRKIAGKRALVTGAASGIGRAIALRLASEGVNLFLVDIDAVGLERVAEETCRVGVEVDTRRCDVGDPEQITAATTEAIDRWAGVDILVNNAGVTYHGFTHMMPDDEWDRLLRINLHSHLQFTRELLPSLLARSPVHVLNVCSMLGLIGLPRVSAYCTTKFALVGFSDSLRNEYARWGLGVTALCPGLVRTNLFEAARPETPGDPPRTPPRWMCTTPDRVAKLGVRAIRRNQPKVMLEPFSRVLHGFRQALPTAFDWWLRLGENRRVARHRCHLASLSDDPTEAIRKLLADQAEKQQGRREGRRARAA